MAQRRCTVQYEYVFYASSKLCEAKLLNLEQNAHSEVAALLLRHGADVNRATTDSAVTPLFAAAFDGFAEVVALLLNAGADVTARSAPHGTPRDAACRADRLEVIKVIDAHLCRQLRSQLVDICAALDLPAFLLIECFAWASCDSMAGEHVELPLELQWRIAKHIRDRRASLTFA